MPTFDLSRRSVAYVLTSLIVSCHVQARCFDPSPAFPLPQHNAYQDSKALKDVFRAVAPKLDKIVSAPEFDISSFSIEVTTSQGSLWEHHHTARKKDPERPGAKTVTGDSVYRMASVTKCFTTLGILQQHNAGNLSIDDTIDTYLSHLTGSIPWHEITLRTVASQLSGIGREFAQSDILSRLSDPLELGLPAVDPKVLPQCDEWAGFDRPCEKEDLFAYLAGKEPLWPPKQKSTYSNVNFELLGLVIEDVTGLSYSDYIEKSILQPLEMNMSSFVPSNDSFAVLPLLPSSKNYWDAEEGVKRPTGGLYSSSSDMSKFIRYVLTHYNGITPQLNWFQPASYSTTLSSFYGTPWEIFRTKSILKSTSRPVTFVTKSGSVPGYLSYIIMLPEYDLGITILTTGTSASLKEKIREALTVPLVKTAEQIAQGYLATNYAGTYTSQHRNTTLVLAHSQIKSLYIERFISNSTDAFQVWKPYLDQLTNSPFRIQLIPTTLYRDEKNQRGSIWRGVITPESVEADLIWDDFCLTDQDPLLYGNEPVLEFVFWGAEDGNGTAKTVELSAFRVTLDREDESNSLDGITKGPYTSYEEVLEEL